MHGQIGEYRLQSLCKDSDHNPPSPGSSPGESSVLTHVRRVAGSLLPVTAVVGDAHVPLVAEALCLLPWVQRGLLVAVCLTMILHLKIVAVNIDRVRRLRVPIFDGGVGHSLATAAVAGLCLMLAGAR